MENNEKIAREIAENDILYGDSDNNSMIDEGCGSCKYFLYEAANGYGYCSFYHKDKFCADTCRDYIERNNL